MAENGWGLIQIISASWDLNCIHFLVTLGRMVQHIAKLCRVNRVMSSALLLDLQKALHISSLLFILSGEWNRDDLQGILQSHTLMTAETQEGRSLCPWVLGSSLKGRPLNQKHTV